MYLFLHEQIPHVRQRRQTLNLHFTRRAGKQKPAGGVSHVLKKNKTKKPKKKTLLSPKGTWPWAVHQLIRSKPEQELDDRAFFNITIEVWSVKAQKASSMNPPSFNLTSSALKYWFTFLNAASGLRRLKTVTCEKGVLAERHSTSATGRCVFTGAA